MFKECLLCKSNNIVKLSNEQKINGLPTIIAPNSVDLNTLLPVNVFCCKDCGFIMLQHIDPKKIKID